MSTSNKKASKKTKVFKSDRSWKGRVILTSEPVGTPFISLRVELHRDGFYHLFRNNLEYCKFKAPEFKCKRHDRLIGNYDST